MANARLKPFSNAKSVLCGYDSQELSKFLFTFSHNFAPYMWRNRFKPRVSLKPTDALLFTVILKQIKIILYTPTCFDPHWDHPQGVLSVLG
jgi:hypothetical protein